MGAEEISPADPPGTPDGQPQDADGVNGPELINVFSWKVLTLLRRLDRHWRMRNTAYGTQHGGICVRWDVLIAQRPRDNMPTS